MRIILFLLAVLIFASCGGEKLEGFDAEKWKTDDNGCNGQRISMKEIFEFQHEKILGLHENELKAMLGKPDKQELYVRSQKFFVYYLEPGPLCQKGNEFPLTLHIRFNSLGFTNEVFLENDSNN